MLDWTRHIVFPKYGEFRLQRPEEYGGNKVYASMEELEDDYMNDRLGPQDLKQNLARILNECVCCSVVAAVMACLSLLLPYVCWSNALLGPLSVTTGCWSRCASTLRSPRTRPCLSRLSLSASPASRDKWRVKSKSTLLSHRPLHTCE